ncbi:hypothetical protein ACLB2K_028837 [Fragaria x ananassa]
MLTVTLGAGKADSVPLVIDFQLLLILHLHLHHLLFHLRARARHVTCQKVGARQPRVTLPYPLGRDLGSGPPAGGSGLGGSSEAHEMDKSAYFSALSFCHENGVTHREVKSQNLLLDDNGDLRLRFRTQRQRFCTGLGTICLLIHSADPNAFDDVILVALMCKVSDDVNQQI